MNRSREQAIPLAAFRQVADATYDWESWLSPRGRLRWVNPAVERMTGYGVEECMRMRDYPLSAVHPEDHERIRQVMASARKGSSGNDVEFRIRRKDGLERWAAISWQSFADDAGQALGHRTSVRDIHERKLAEERLREALVLVEQAAAARNEFLANVSHELRTPLQCILGYTQLLQRDAGGPDLERHLAAIIEQAEALLGIVGNVLDMAALKARPVELVYEEADLRAKLASIVEGAKPLAREKGLSLKLEVAPRAPRHIQTDRLRLRQIITNLLSNAIKFTDSGEVTVRALPAKKRGSSGFIRIEVHDTGIGISDEAKERIFEPFAQADGSIARRFGGTGLGLSIAKQLADGMGGRIEVTSRPGKGSCFAVELPVREPAASTSRALPVGQRASLDATRPARVMLVDDSPAVRVLMGEMLRSLGIDTTLAAGGEEAVALSQKQAFDLILMDLQMPDVDGLTAAQLIRAHTAPHGSRPHIVALTADAFGRALAIGPAGGMDGFLVKPVRLKDLSDLVSQLGFETSPSEAREREQRSARTESHKNAVLDPQVVSELVAQKDARGRSLLSRMGPKLVSENRELLRELERAERAQDLDAVRRAAHRIKGNCLVLGARRAASLAAQLDEKSASASEGERKGTTSQLRRTPRSAASAELENALTELEVALLNADEARERETKTEARRARKRR
jgi:PAS domain S-box-containing protein